MMTQTSVEKGQLVFKKIMFHGEGSDLKIL